MTICPHCGHRLPNPLYRAKLPVVYVMNLVDGLDDGDEIRVRNVFVPEGMTMTQIRAAFCYLQTRGLIRRTRYGWYGRPR